MNRSSFIDPVIHAAAFELVDTGLGVVDPDGIVRTANSAWLHVVGLRLDEVVDRAVSDLFPEFPDLPLLVTTCLHSGERLSVPRRFRVVGDRTCWWEGSLTPITAGERAVVLFRVQDVSDQVTDGTSGELPGPLGEAERRLLGTILDAAPAAMAVVDSRSLILRWANAGFLGLLGSDVRLTDVAGQPLDRLLSWAAEVGLFETIGQVASGATRFLIVQLQHPSSGAEHSYWRWSVLALPEVPGQPLSVLLLAIDVTREVLAQWRVEELAEQAERSLAQLEAVVNSMNDALLVADPHGGVLVVNLAGARLFGFENPHAARDFLQQHQRRMHYWHLDGRPLRIWEHPLNRALRGESFQNLELRMRLPGVDREIIGSFSGASVREITGEVILAIVTVRDIAAQKRIEAERQFLNDTIRELSSTLEYERIFIQIARLAVPVLGDWSAVYMRDGDVLRRVAIVHADPRKAEVARELHERYAEGPRSPNDLIVKVVETGEPILVPTIDAALLREWVSNAEHRKLLRRLGMSSYFILPLWSHGHTVGALALAMSRPARVFTPELMSLADEFARRAVLAIDNAHLYRVARDAIAARDVFLSVAAHELKTPIASLKGFAQAAKRIADTSGAATDARLSRSLEVVNLQADKLVQLVGQLLEVSRLEMGRLVLQPEIVDLADLIVKTVANARLRTEQHTLSFEGPEHLQARVDPLRIEQVFTNLLDNAIKYSPGGPIRVRLQVSGRERVEISVCDSGPGIAPEHRRRIFDRFYQVKADSGPGGLGLGLYITREIVDLHAGVLRAEFPPEGGTCMIVELPLGLDQEAA